MPITFLFVDQSSPSFFAQGGRVIVDHLFFRFSIRGSVPEIFVIEVDSCLKSRQILDVFLPSQILGGGPSPKVVSTLIPLPVAS